MCHWEFVRNQHSVSTKLQIMATPYCHLDRLLWTNALHADGAYFGGSDTAVLSTLDTHHTVSSSSGIYHVVNGGRRIQAGAAQLNDRFGASIYGVKHSGQTSL